MTHLISVEHLLAQINTWNAVDSCVNNNSEKIHAYIIKSLYSLVRVLGYSVPTAIFGILINSYTAFYWSFIDLFLITISMALASRFRILNLYLKRNIGKVCMCIEYVKLNELYNTLIMIGRGP